MPNIIPPIVSSSPPPLDPVEDDHDDDDEDDDFGDFAAADVSVDRESLESKSLADTLWKTQTFSALNEKSFLYENGMSVSSSEIAHKDSVFLENNSVLDEGSGTSSPDCALTTEHYSASQTLPSKDASCQKNCGNSNGCENNSYNGSIQSSKSIDKLTPLQDALESLNDLSLKSESNRSPHFSDFNSVNTDNAFSLDEGSSLKSHLPDSPDSPDDLFKPHSHTSFEIVTQLKAPFSGTTDESLSDNSGLVPSIDKTEHRNVELQEISNTQSSCEGCVTFSCSALDEDLAKNASDIEEDESVKAMIVPNVPILDGDCGDVYKFQLHNCTSEPVDIGDKVFTEFESPSRRPTLVLSEDAGEIAAQDAIMLNEHLSSGSMENDFQEIETLASSNVCVGLNIPVNFDNTRVSSSAPDISDGNDFGEFADFTQAGASFSSELKSSEDWVEQSAAQIALENVESTADLDDFNDFESAAFQSNETGEDLPSKTLFDFSSVKPRLNAIFREIFPCEEGCDEPQDLDHSSSIGSGVNGIVLDVEESPVWQGLRDLESTPSLSFQWPGSHSNRGLLGSLNIDSRNILFGPKWNTVVPRFAANLGFSPLEPVRAVQAQPPESSPQSDCLQAQIEPVSRVTASTSGDTVPAAQFDWSDSGLVNPLDSSTLSALLDLDLLATFDSLTSCSPPSLPSPHAAVSCRSLSSSKDSSKSVLATTVTSGNPVLASAQLLEPSRACEFNTQDPKVSPEAARILDSLPELAFLSARMLMFPVQNDSNAHKL